MFSGWTERPGNIWPHYFRTQCTKNLANLKKLSTMKKTTISSLSICGKFCSYFVKNWRKKLEIHPTFKSFKSGQSISGKNRFKSCQMETQSYLISPPRRGSKMIKKSSASWNEECNKFHLIIGKMNLRNFHQNIVEAA